jgi:hypothetical protein
MNHTDSVGNTSGENGIELDVKQTITKKQFSMTLVEIPSAEIKKGLLLGSGEHSLATL